MNVVKDHIAKGTEQQSMLNFEELEKGFTEEEALEEARRCLKCKNPLCVKGCPIENRIPEIVRAIEENPGCKVLLLDKHGIAALGLDVANAYNLADLTEELAWIAHLSAGV